MVTYDVVSMVMIYLGYSRTNQQIILCFQIVELFVGIICVVIGAVILGISNDRIAFSDWLDFQRYLRHKYKIQYNNNRRKIVLN